MFRAAAGISIRELARRANVSDSYIHKVESGQSDPSLAVLRRVAAALNVHAVDLLDEGHGTPREQIIVRRDNRRMVHVDREAVAEVWSLLPASGSWPFKAEWLCVHPGDQIGVRAHSGYDFGHVANGAIELTVGDEIYDLEQGDSFAFLGLRPHRLRNKSRTPAELLWVTVAPHGS